MTGNNFYMYLHKYTNMLLYIQSNLWILAYIFTNVMTVSVKNGDSK